VLQAGQQPRIDRLLLIEMEKRDTGVGAQHIVARERQGAGVQIADQQRCQQSDTKRAADKPKEHDHGKTDAGVGEIERVLHRHHHRRHLSAEGEAEQGGQQSVERPRTAEPHRGNRPAEDRHRTGPEDRKNAVMPRSADQTSDDERAQNRAAGHRDQTHAGRVRRQPRTELEIERYQDDHRNHHHRHRKADQAGDCEDPVGEKPERNDRLGCLALAINQRRQKSGADRERDENLAPSPAGCRLGFPEPNKDRCCRRKDQGGSEPVNNRLSPRLSEPPQVAVAQ